MLRISTTTAFLFYLNVYAVLVDLRSRFGHFTITILWVIRAEREELRLRLVVYAVRSV